MMSRSKHPESVSPYTELRVPVSQRMCNHNRASDDPPLASHAAHMVPQHNKNVTRIAPFPQ